MANHMVQPQGRPDLDEAADLAQRFAQGDVRAFDQAVELHAATLARLAERLLGWSDDAPDALQEALMNAYLHRRSFRSQSSLLTWLTQITINTCRSFNRRRLTRWAALRRLAFWRTAEAAPVNMSTTDRDESTLQVHSAIRKLAAKDREIIILHYLEDHSVAQLAELLHCSPATIHVRLHRARHRLGELLGPMMEQP